MKGKYHFRVKSKKLVFEFNIKRNITILKGDSASGKTTLLRMMYEYLRVGKKSGYSVSTDANYFVYLRKEVRRDWEDELLGLSNTVIFIEENNNFVFSKKFADFVKDSGNYFVIVNRASIKNLPYSVHEIYELVISGKHAGTEETHKTFGELYSNHQLTQCDEVKNIITEDSNSGYQFFENVFDGLNVLSAGGNSNIVNELKKLDDSCLVIADGAAFGAMVDELMQYLAQCVSNRVTVWVPESFEYLILKSGLIKSDGLDKILDSTENYADSKKYESWEKFYTSLLISLTQETPFKYSKRKLNKHYLQPNNVKKIIEQFPIEIFINKY